MVPARAMSCSLLSRKLWTRLTMLWPTRPLTATRVGILCRYCFCLDVSYGSRVSIGIIPMGLNPSGNDPARDCTNGIEPARDCTLTVLILNRIALARDCTYTGFNPKRIAPARNCTNTELNSRGILSAYIAIGVYQKSHGFNSVWFQYC